MELTPATLEQVLALSLENESFPSLKRLPCLKILAKLTNFFNYNLNMAKHDIVSEWRLQLFVQKILPSAEELHQLFNSRQFLPKEILLAKTVVEMSEAFLQRDVYHNRTLLCGEVYKLKKALYKRMADTKGLQISGEAQGALPTQVQVVALQSWQLSREMGKLNGFYKHVQVHCSVQEAMNTI
mmetsp:Transcript_6712/g.10780  ORF Transcript_6712/g.10780 Transcript_6712/m.10780 type:complete len:183 (+) Transcript_6712:1611-2159(+)